MAAARDPCQDPQVDETDWDERVSAAWAAAGQLSDAELMDRIDALAAELPADSAAGLFERAGARDATDQPELAVPLYRQALRRGLAGSRRRRAVIQLASSLRNLGQADESVALLTTELSASSDDLDDAVRAFLALALTDVGREREAVCLALSALVPHLPRYQRAVDEYVQLLAGPAADGQ
jgi:Arc/MetJ family transcription regulator